MPRKKQNEQKPTKETKGAAKHRSSPSALHPSPSTKKKGPNPASQVAFLSAYVVTGANVTAAAAAAKINPCTHYDWLANDSSYPERFEAARQAACDAVEAEIFRRGQLGYDEPVVYQGLIARDDEGRPVTVRRYSDTLLIFRAKAIMPEKYGDKTKLEHSGAVNVLRLVEDENFNNNDAHERARHQAPEAPAAPDSSPGVGGTL